MAKKYKFEVEADTGSAKNDLSGIADKLSDISVTAQAAGAELGNVGKMTPALVKGFKGVGSAIKAAFAATGIGIVALLFDMFKNNQKVLDIFNTAVSAIQNVFNDIFQLVQPLLDSLMKLFTDPKEAIKELGKMIKDYVINYFNQAWDIIKNLGGAIANLFTGDWEGLKANLKEIGTSVTDAILGSEGASEKMLENVKEAVKEASKLTDLLNKVKIAEAELEKLREKGDLRLEKLRQLRDDESKSLSERIAANEELGKALEEQIVKELELAKLRTAAAKLEWETKKNIENQADYIRAQAAEIAVMNRLEGQRSEMLMNTNSLLREQNDIQKSAREAAQQVADIQREIDKLAIASTLERLQFDLDSIEKKKQAQLTAIETELQGVQAGTARYQELLNERAVIEAQANLDRLTKNQEYLAEKERQDKEALDREKANLEAFSAWADQNAQASKEREKMKADYVAGVAESLAGSVGTIFSENAGVQKGIAIAEATISTYKGAAMNLSATPFMPLNIIMAAATVAAGIATVAKIAKQKIPGKGGGAGGGASIDSSMPGGGGRQPGSFSMVQPLNQQITTALDQSKLEPQRAYVVSGDIESAAELDRNIKANARG